MKTNKLQKKSLSLLFKAKKFAKAVETKNNPEKLHHFRTNIRKIRSIFKDFRPYLEKSSYENLSVKLKFLLTSSNKLRDTDVFLKYLEEYAQLIPENLQEKFFILKNKIKQEKKLEHKKMIEFIDSEEFVNHFHSIKKILKKDKIYKKRIRKHFKKTTKIVLKKIEKKVKLKKDNLYKNSDSKTFHELRILYKRLRYLNEIFVKKDKSNINKFKEIQAILGNIQDLGVQQKMLEDQLSNELKPLIEFLINILKTKQNNYKITFLE
jgi:CHAD domain-containing protein